MNQSPSMKWTPEDTTSFHNGKHFRLYHKLGSQLEFVDGVEGVNFAVYAPEARDVYVMGDFNEWQGYDHELILRKDHSGIWSTFVPGAKKGDKYKYIIISKNNTRFDKADPFAWIQEQPPGNSSVIWDLEYEWSDQMWMKDRKKHNSLDAPWSIYEVHLESWRKKSDREYPLLSYRELAAELIPYVKDLGFTHIELMPITEYPFPGSWGYQATGYFAPTSRFGTPQDFMYFIDQCHQNEIGIILDWVPSHFPSDGHGLGYFDGSHLYEHPDARKGYHPDWKSLIFNYEKNEIRSFLISSGLFWFDLYHIDGVRVDAVASIIHLDYSRPEGEWERNHEGGRDYLAGISFLQEFNSEVYANFPDVQTIAEESTDHAKVSHPVDQGGLGFGMKWMMGWMHDSLDYFKHDPIYRKHHHDKITFSIWYAFSENFMLPYSHDEVVHGKSAMIYKMPGDLHDKFAHLRSLYTYMWTHPGAKLMFMGDEFAQTSEWNYLEQLDWGLLEHNSHRGIMSLIKKLNELLKSEPAMHAYNFEGEGYEWCLKDENEDSILAYYRKSKKKKDELLIIHNLTPVLRKDYKVPLFKKGKWKEIFSSDDIAYDGDYRSSNKVYKSMGKNKKAMSIEMDLRPLSSVILKRVVKKKKIEGKNKPTI